MRPIDAVRFLGWLTFLALIRFTLVKLGLPSHVNDFTNNAMMAMFFTTISAIRDEGREDAA